ncbi:hypothetical protein RGU75_16200 [Glaciimonas sp. CA11.2]|uniref:hypothetical protein n=1 Tax=Glaciimonas sp. CA11.2 TaxID=3048601 RepID=UPI002AB4A2C9|nr:hypothetical protein [Glaciimonas sp. CA11.2]MDY7547766.1 hypothetical protein [Glaciimonas sp. CA11.2]
MDDPEENDLSHITNEGECKDIRHWFLIVFILGFVALFGKKRNFPSMELPLKLDGLVLPAHKIGRRMTSHLRHWSRTGCVALRKKAEVKPWMVCPPLYWTA